MDDYHFNYITKLEGGEKKKKNTLGPYSHENRKMKRNYYELCGKKNR